MGVVPDPPDRVGVTSGLGVVQGRTPHPGIGGVPGGERLHHARVGDHRGVTVRGGGAGEQAEALHHRGGGPGEGVLQVGVLHRRR
ncbi:MAG: hypothetical protein EOL89_09275 [Actinobacteria bacterium]|nr:hypothetical protein [Actinomycetota bacterium]